MWEKSDEEKAELNSLVGGRDGRDEDEDEDELLV